MFASLGIDQQAAATRTLLVLPADVGLADPRITVPLMAALADRHPRLNVLNLEAAASARALDATVLLSPKGAEGVLPHVLDAEGLPWETVHLLA